MCWLSVQCACKHNIAIPHPTKACIRPRNPRGCWIIRRGDPLKSSCPGCEEYYNPGCEQPSWKDVRRCHYDPMVDWAEVNHFDIIAMDRSRHRGCDSERLDFRRRLRWKALVSNGMVTGWTLTDRGAVICQPIEEETVGNESMEEDNHGLELMEPIDLGEIRKILVDSKQKKDEEDEEDVGYKLERMSSRPRLVGSFYTNGNPLDFESLFQVSDNSDSDMSDSDNSNEAVNGSDESGNAITGTDSDKEGGGEPLLKLDEMFDKVEASKPFSPSSPTLNNDTTIWAPVPPDSPTGDPVKKPLFQTSPIRLEIKKEPDTAVMPVTATSEPSPSITVTSGVIAPAYREGIDQALARLKRMSAAYFEAINAEFPDPTPTTTSEENSNDGPAEGDAEEGHHISFQFN
ncbi:hypothetical protein TWF506_005296 [Arthrobotrys conoides]|uniref:Uncharacterized protein n=1 Tax=Arthrobotrys conoides TaxID=74498 RepID=A0AAN8NBJ7_9PEZI